MQITDVKALLDFGFTTVFAVAVIIFVFKYFPSIIHAVNRFTDAIASNTRVTEEQTEALSPLKSQLERLKVELEKHDTKAEELKKGHERLEKNQAEVLDLIRDIYRIITKGEN